MPKKAKELSAVEVRRLKTPGQYAVGGVPGLSLRVGEGAAKSWVLRYMDGSRRSEMGLGAFPEVELAQARGKAKVVRDSLRAGTRPVLTRGAHSRRAVPTFRDAVRRYLLAKQDEWKNSKTGLQWSHSLTTYAFPTIGALSVDQISRQHVYTLLEPIWRNKTTTATRVRERIENILDYSKSHGWRSGDNPAAWAGGLKGLLPEPRRISPVKNHAALDWREGPAYMAQLRAVNAMSARCLEFIILTAARFGQARGATWDEIDLQARLWKVPGERMKGRKGAEKAHVVPLSDAAVALLKGLRREEGALLVFPSVKSGRLISDVALSKTAKRIRGGITVHGFRSTFRTWASEATDVPREVAEQALAHSLGNAVESAYARGDLLEKRKALMGAWSAYLAKPTASVVRMNLRREK